MSDSFSEQLRALPKAYKLLTLVLTLLGGAAGFGFSLAIKMSEYATKAYVSTALAQHVDKKRNASSPEESAHPVYETGLRGVELRVFNVEQQIREETAFRFVVMLRIVSGEAADLEPDRRYKFDASAFARNEFTRLVKEEGFTLEAAAKQTIDALPAWRRRGRQ